MAIVVGSAHLDDETFLAAFVRCELPLSCFRHGDHLRLAWMELHDKPFAEALASVRTGIRAFAAHHGVGQIFHETMTRAWVTLLATHGESSFAEFLEKHEHRLQGDLLHQFWTPALLSIEKARRVWIAPDRQALPT